VLKYPLFETEIQNWLFIICSAQIS